MRKIFKAWMRKIHLIPDPNDYAAQISGSGNVDIDDIINEMLKEDPALKRENVADLIKRFNRKSADLALSGYNVNTGLVQVSPVIKGGFNGKTWNPKVNTVSVSITQGNDLQRAVAETPVEILGEQAEALQIPSVLQDINKH